MFKLLVFLFIIKLYAQYDIFVFYEVKTASLIEKFTQPPPTK